MFLLVVWGPIDINHADKIQRAPYTFSECVLPKVFASSLLASYVNNYPSGACFISCGREKLLSTDIFLQEDFCMRDIVRNG